jgi:hypothetical protein
LIEHAADDVLDRTPEHVRPPIRCCGDSGLNVGMGSSERGVIRKSPEKTSPPPASVAVQNVSNVVGTLPMTAMNWLVLFISEPVAAWFGETTLYVLFPH